jgi:hypothetical protein
MYEFLPNGEKKKIGDAGSVEMGMRPKFNSVEGFNLSKKEKTAVWVILAIILVVGLGIAVYMMTRGSKSGQKAVTAKFGMKSWGFRYY